MRSRVLAFWVGALFASTFASTVGCGDGSSPGSFGGAGGAAGAGGRAGAGGAGAGGLGGVGAGGLAGAGAGGLAGAGAGGLAGAGGMRGVGGGAGSSSAGGGAGLAGAAGGGGIAGSAGAAGVAGTAGAGGGAAGSGAGGAGGGGVVTCDPNDQTTCPTNQRCTWVAVTATTGYPACLADGTVAQGGACAAGPYGAATGFDACKRGLACANGQCQPICKTSNDTCGTHFVCTNYSSVFYSSGTILAGVCAPTCNPLTQARDYDAAPACGSPTPATPALGCFGKSVFTCSKVVYPNNKSDAPAAGPSSGGFYLNGCAPGYLPALTAATGSTQQICVALCQPGPTSMDAPADAGGVTPSTCAAAGAASPHECRYWWWLENTSLSSFPDALSNTMGFCIDYTKYTGNKSGTGTAPYPSCTALSTSAHTYDATLTDTQYWGCEPYPTTP